MHQPNAFPLSCQSLKASLLKQRVVNLHPNRPGWADITNRGLYTLQDELYVSTSNRLVMGRQEAIRVAVRLNLLF